MTTEETSQTEANLKSMPNPYNTSIHGWLKVFLFILLNFIIACPLMAEEYVQIPCPEQYQKHDTVIVQVDTSYDYNMEEFYTFCQGDFQNYPIHIKYKQPINGYKVSVIWFTSWEWRQGFAVIKFEEENKDAFFVANEEFYIEGFDDIMDSLYMSQLYLPDKGHVSNVKTKVFIMDYHTDPNPIDSLRYDAPFFFSDVDFDGQRELVLTLYKAGQRFVNKYKVYNMRYGYASDFSEVKEKPYTLFDGLTTFDYENKKVSIYHSMGVFDSFEDIYQYCDTTYLPLVYEKSIY